MYDHPAVRWATDALWSALAATLAAHGVAVPEALDRRADYPAVWREPGLILSQTCGYPYVTALREEVRLVATPTYRAEGCDGGRYCSMLVVRADDPALGLDDLRGRQVAFNALDSQSGHNALRTMLAPLAHGGRFFGSRVVTGSHGASADTVASGDADLCAIDCVTWALLARHEPERVAGLRVLGRSAAAPGLPLITGQMVPLAVVRAAVLTVLADPALAAVREALLLEGAEVLTNSDYGQVLEMERSALVMGYASLD